MFDTYDLPGYQLIARAPTLWDCNWLQVKENSMDPAHVAFLHTLPGSEGFSEDFKELAEWDWMETPVGMVYIDTRRYEDKVWVRVADFILPNIHQFPPNHGSGRPPQHPQPPAGHHLGGAARRHAHDADRLLPRARRQGSAARHGVRSGRQLGPMRNGSGCPGDWDAQVSIHDGMSRHGLEHLTSTDRGLIMMRNMLRRGIRSVSDGPGPRLSAS